MLLSDSKEIYQHPLNHEKEESYKISSNYINEDLKAQTTQLANTLADTIQTMQTISNKIDEYAKNTNDKLHELSIKETHVTNQNNSKHFNLNIFLNEKCKGAINITDFIDNIQPDFQNLEYVGTHGYVDGITKIIMNGLNQLDVHERPFHCTDLKRVVMHIREENKWNRDTPENTKMKKFIEDVANKNMRLIHPWQKANPECEILDSNMYQLWTKIALQSINPSSSAIKNNNEILYNIAKNVVVNKQQFAALTV
jgi:hypothetical protein